MNRSPGAGLALALLPMLATGCGSSSEWPLACEFIPVESSSDRVAECAALGEEGGIALQPTVAAANAAAGEVVTVVVDEQLLFAIASGRTAPALPFDNGADYFVEGLARTIQDGKVGFVDETLETVIEPTWDFAFPFESGLAVVCAGCRAQSVGEHIERSGGQWGYIDRAGRVVVPMAASRREMMSRHQVLAMDERLHGLFDATHRYKKVMPTLEQATTLEADSDDP